MYAAGLRVSEACSLRAADVELDAALISCHGKGSKERMIPIGKSAVHWLQRYLASSQQFGNEGKAELFLHRGRMMTPDCLVNH
jgi:integrase/recombinase XerD